MRSFLSRLPRQLIAATAVLIFAGSFLYPGSARADDVCDNNPECTFVATCDVDVQDVGNTVEINWGVSFSPRTTSYDATYASAYLIRDELGSSINFLGSSSGDGAAGGNYSLNKSDYFSGVYTVHVDGSIVPPAGGTGNSCSQEAQFTIDAEPPPPPPPPDDHVYGCTDPDANNYNVNADVDDGSCVYPPGAVYGCTDSGATNYNASATVDDDSCTYPPPPPPTAPTLTTACSNWPSPKVDWNFNDVGATSYEVQKWHVYYYYNLRAGTYDQTYGRADEDPLADGTDNWYRVVATNASGSTNSNETYHAVTKANCGGGTLTTGISAGAGTVTGTEGLNCSSASCTKDYNVEGGKWVNLIATPGAAYDFAGWSGACAGEVQTSCWILMSGDASAYASFTLKQYGLGVAVAQGSGSISGSGFTCPSIICQLGFSHGSSPSITATPSAGYTFDHWTGACTGTNPSCTISMDGDKAAYALFAPNSYGVGVAISEGEGTISGSGLSCPGTCSAGYEYGEWSTFTATPATGYSFWYWTGACEDQGATCSLHVTGDKAAYAHFAANSYTLSVAIDGTGSGAVTGGGIDCPGTCVGSYAYNTPITLTPTAATGSTFSGWSGACSGTGNCVVTINGIKSVTATFNTSVYTLTATVNGTGSGNVSGAGLSCPGVCVGSYVNNTPITLTPVASSGSTFAGWSGACSGTGNCVVTMTQNLAVTATFTLVPFNYSLSNSGAVNVTKTSGDAYGQSTITKTLVAGSSQSVSLSLSGVPSGVSYSISNSTCSPSCASTITFTVGPSAPVGSHTITVTGSPLSKTTAFTLVITGAPITVSCQASPSTTLLGSTVTWSASIVGGVAPLSYEWSGTNIETPGPTTASFSKTYSTIGPKTAQLTVTDGDGVASTCPAGTVQVNFDPDFDEF